MIKYLIDLQNFLEENADKFHVTTILKTPLRIEGSNITGRSEENLIAADIGRCSTSVLYFLRVIKRKLICFSVK